MHKQPFLLTILRLEQSSRNAVKQNLCASTTRENTTNSARALVIITALGDMTSSGTAILWELAGRDNNLPFLIPLLKKHKQQVTEKHQTVSLSLLS